MKYQLAGFTIFDTTLLIKARIWLKTRFRHRCRECEHFGENWLNAQDGMGLYRFGFCWEKVHDTVLVDGDIPRTCRRFVKNKRKGYPSGSGADMPPPGSEPPNGGMVIN